MARVRRCACPYCDEVVACGGSGKFHRKYAYHWHGAWHRLGYCRIKYCEFCEKPFGDNRANFETQKFCTTDCTKAHKNEERRIARATEQRRETFWQDWLSSPNWPSAANAITGKIRYVAGG